MAAIFLIQTSSKKSFNLVSELKKLILEYLEEKFGLRLLWILVQDKMAERFKVQVAESFKVVGSNPSSYYPQIFTHHTFFS
jgi:hypothetical protein